MNKTWFSAFLKSVVFFKSFEPRLLLQDLLREIPAKMLQKKEKFIHLFWWFYLMIYFYWLLLGIRIGQKYSLTYNNFL